MKSNNKATTQKQIQTASLFDTLQDEFCPTLDSSLIAALVFELELEIESSSGNATAPPTPPLSKQRKIEALRRTLKELAEHAQAEAELSELSGSDLQEQQLTDQFGFGETVSSWTTLDSNTPTSTGTTPSGSDDSSDALGLGFSEPLGFLRAALPGIPIERLRAALKDAGADAGERGEGEGEEDMWDVVANILTEEAIREMEERGLGYLPEEEDRGDEEGQGQGQGEGRWEVVQVQKNSKKRKTKTQGRARKINLGDVRQQHQVQHQVQKKSVLPTKHPGVPPPPARAVGAAADPWTQISSLSEYLATLLPPHPPSTFQSFFHSPLYATSYDALRAALTSLCPPASESESDGHGTVLYNLLDLITPEYDSDVDAEERARIVRDAELAVDAARGRGAEALDLVNLLRELDSNRDMGVYHAQPPESPTNVKARRRPPGIPPDPPPAKVKHKPPPPLETVRNKPSPYQWQAVPQRKGPTSPHVVLQPYTPSYARDVNGMRTSRRGLKHQGVQDWELRRRVEETMRRRDEALREAARMWHRGNAKTRGGEVAFYFAERARELQEVARREALCAVREMVREKRDGDTVDLHGTTVAEAVVIVREILKEEGALISAGKPLKIITGRGAHSLNQVSVLKPAVRKALVEDGWVVGSWDGGLIVHERRGRTFN